MHDRAGLTARPEDLIDLDALLGAYETVQPDMTEPQQRVVFGTSGHRGSSLDGAFNQAHILAIAQSIAEYRATQGVDGPLFLGVTPTACPNPPSAPRWRCWAPTGSRC